MLWGVFCAWVIEGFFPQREATMNTLHLLLFLKMINGIL